MVPSANPFGPIVGDLLETFLCEYKSNRGTLYLTSRGLCFHSTFLSFETSRLVISWKSVQEINQVEGNDIVSIAAKHSGGVTRVYDFRVLNGTARDIFIKDIRDTHQKYGGESASMNGLETVHEERTDCEGSSNTADAKARKQLCDQVSGVSSESDLKDEKELSSDKSPEKPWWIRRSLSEPLTKSTKKKADKPNINGSEADFLAECTISAMAGFRQPSQVIKAKKEALGIGDKESKPDESDTGPDGNGASVPRDVLRAWKDCRDSKDPSFKEVVCKRTALPCSVGDFFNTFLCDDAPHSLASFQAVEKGDSDFDTSDWARSDDGFTFTRTMNYIHPINAPMAPPKAQARKRQTLRRFGEHGLCMETETKIDDVPYSDCFFVEDRILIESLPEGGVGLIAVFEVRFVKTTLMRRFIESKTLSEYQGFWKGFVEMVKRELANSDLSNSARQETKAVPILEPDIIVEQPKIEPWMRWGAISFVAFVTLTQLLLLCKVFSLEGSIINLEAALQTCQSTN